MKRQRYRPGDVVEFRTAAGTAEARILRPCGVEGASPHEYVVRVLSGPLKAAVANLSEYLITKKVRAGARRLTRRRR